MQLTDVESRIVDTATSTRGPGRHAVRSAIRYLERAWQLSDEMPDVAVFLGITAEEESAAAVFHALKKRRYARAKELNPRSHLQKNALHPFLLALGKIYQPFHEAHKFSLMFDESLSRGRGELLRLRMVVDRKGNEEICAVPEPPLDVVTMKNGKPFDLTEQLNELASEKKAKSAYDYVQELKNKRNEVLYSSSAGIPHVQNASSYIRYRQSVVMSHIIGNVLIDQWNTRQTLPEHALSLYLDMLQKVPVDAET